MPAAPFAADPADVDVRLRDLLALKGSAEAAAIRPADGRGRLPGGHVVPTRGSAGRGLSPADSRPYQPGDDVRSIDWRATARQGKPHTKVFEEEREQPCWIVVDRHPGMHFGSRGAFKSVVAARAAAWLAWAARAAGDRAGAVLADPGGFVAVPPRRGDDGVLAVLRALCVAPAGAPRSGDDAVPLARALEHVCPEVGAGHTVFVLSDFADLAETAATGTCPSAGPLERLAGRARTVLVAVLDRLDLGPPPSGRYPVRDESGTRWLDLADPELRAHWEARHRQRMARLESIAVRHACPLAVLMTDGDLAASLRPVCGSRP